MNLIICSSIERIVKALKMDTDEYHYKLMTLIENNPETSQRAIAKSLNVSLGKVNFCLKSLMDKGLVKAKNFKNSSNKRAYMYILTSHGIEDKAMVTARFLRRKMEEYEKLQQEIEQLKKEVAAKK